MTPSPGQTQPWGNGGGDGVAGRFFVRRGLAVGGRAAEAHRRPLSMRGGSGLDLTVGQKYS